MTWTAPDGASVLIDSAPLIYLLEGHALATHFRAVFADIDSGRLQAVVTSITLAEVVAGPLRKGNDALAEKYRLAMTTHPWRVRAVDEAVAMLASRLRIRHRWKLPDAIQAASAVLEGCHTLVTHDRDFRGFHDVAVFAGA